MKPRPGSTSRAKARFGLIVDIITAQLRLIRTLRGLTPEFGCFDDAGFDEERFERHLEADPRLATAALLVLDPQAAGALLRRRPCAAIAAASKARTAAVDVAGALREGGVPFLCRAGAGRTLATRPLPTERPGHSRPWPPTTASSRSGLSNCPENFAEPRRAGRRRDRPDRRPRARRRAALRAGHPLGPRQRLCPQRGDRLRAGRALLRRRAASRRVRRGVSAECPRLLSPLGRRWQGTAARSVLSAAQGGRSQCPIRRARSGHRSNTWTSQR